MQHNERIGSKRIALVWIVLLALLLLWALGSPQDNLLARQQTVDRQAFFQPKDLFFLTVSAKVHQREIDTWRTVDGLFHTATEEPLILFRSDPMVLYVQHNALWKLQFEQDRATPESLLQWEQDRVGGSWGAGSALLMPFACICFIGMTGNGSRPSCFLGKSRTVFMTIQQMEKMHNSPRYSTQQGKAMRYPLSMFEE